MRWRVFALPRAIILAAKGISLRTKSIAILIVIPADMIGMAAWTISGGTPYGDKVLVTHVTDGDTIDIGRGWRYTRLRLIGVDTPETKHPDKPIEFYGPEASAFTKQSLEWKRVHIELDTENEFDVYGRMLGYVFLPDGSLFNAELVKKGYARVIAPVPFRYYTEFKQYEREARAKRIGIWSKYEVEEVAAVHESGKITGNTKSKIYHLPGQAHYSRIKEENIIYFNTEEEARQAGYRRSKK